MVAVQDDAQRRMTSAGYRVLRRLKAQGSLRIDYRGTFALIGYTGRRRPRFVKQVSFYGRFWSFQNCIDSQFQEKICFLIKIVSNERHTNCIPFFFFRELHDEVKAQFRLVPEFVYLYQVS